MRWTLSILLTVAAILGLIALSHQAYEHRVIYGTVYARNNGTVTHISPIVKGPVYPKSLWLGGVGSAAELLTVLDIDPVLNREYSACRDGIEFHQLAKDTYVFSTFRVGDRIAWTRKPIHVKAGEWVIQCGQISLLARCLNRISLTPQVPTDPVNTAELESPESPDFPPVAAFPSGTDGTFSPITPLWIPPTTEHSSQQPSPIGPLSPIGGGCCAASVPVVVTPEPTILQLLACAAFGFCGVKLVKALVTSWKESA